MAKKSGKSTENKTRLAVAQDRANKIQKNRKMAKSKQTNQNNKRKEKRGGILEYFKGSFSFVHACHGAHMCPVNYRACLIKSYVSCEGYTSNVTS